MGDFEKDLRDAFEGVEFAPSEQVWAGVEKGLRPRKKGIFFMWQTYGVAATLVLVLSLGYLFRDQLFSDASEGPATRELTQKEKEAEPKQKNEAQDAVTEPQEGNTAIDQTPPNDLVKEAEPNMKDLQANNADISTGSTSSTSLTDNASSTNDQALARLSQIQTEVQSESINSSLDARKQDGVGAEEVSEKTLLIDPTFMGPLTLKELKESIVAIQNRWNHNNLVEPMEIAAGVRGLSIDNASIDQSTSLNGSFGNSAFNVNSVFGTNDLAASEAVQFEDNRFAGNLTADSAEEVRSELGSVSVGFGVGLPLGNKWVLKSGLRYSQYRFMGTSNAYSIENGEQLPIYTRVAFDATDVQFAGDYNITNTLHSLSVPAQFGWKFVNIGRFGTWFNFGVAADYLVSHTVKGDLNFLEKRTVDFSESNFINRFNLNALTGLEFTYELNEKFALSGEVFFRQFIPIGTGDTSSSISPSVLGFGLGLNYYLKSKK